MKTFQSFFKFILSVAVVAFVIVAIGYLRASAFNGPSQSPPNGSGLVGFGNSNNMSIGTLTPSSSVTLLLVGSTTNSSNYALEILDSSQNPLFSVRDDGVITISTSTVISGGSYSGTISAGNVSAGQFGFNTGGGNYSFPGELGIGTTTNAASVYIVGSPATLYLNPSGSSTGTPSTFGFSPSMTSGQAARLAFGDVYNTLQTGYNQDLQMYSYNPIIIEGRTVNAASAQPFIAQGGNFGTGIWNVGQSSAVVMQVVGMNGQSGDLADFITSSTSATPVAKIDSVGDITTQGKVGIGTTTLASALTVAGQITSGLFDATATTASTIINFSLGERQKIVLGTSATTLYLSNFTSWGNDQLTVCQDGTGSRTVTWAVSSTNAVATVDWGNAGTPTLSTGANKCDIFSFSAQPVDTNQASVIVYGEYGSNGFGS